MLEHVAQQCSWIILVQQWPMWCGVKNAFGISVYSKEYTCPILLRWKIKYRPELNGSKHSLCLICSQLLREGNFDSFYRSKIFAVCLLKCLSYVFNQRFCPYSGYDEWTRRPYDLVFSAFISVVKIGSWFASFSSKSYWFSLSFQISRSFIYHFNLQNDDSDDFIIWIVTDI
jgi:hypothetical protein